MSTIPVLPRRVMKARRESECPVCHCPIRVGQHIAYCGGMWMHASCIIGHRHQRNGTCQDGRQ
jgi:hypothetical protein